MPHIKRKIVVLKLAVIAVVLSLAAFGYFRALPNFGKTYASASGPSPSHTNAPGEDNCTACHGDFPVNSGSGSVSIAGIPANYLPNQQFSISVTTSQADAVVYGFQLTAIDSLGKQTGTITLPTQSPAQMRLVDGLVNGNPRRYVEHTSSGIIPTQFGSKTWTFTYTAPASRVGRISFHAAGNAANSNGDTSGDYIYTTAKFAYTGTANANFDGDGKSDISVFRPSNGVWYSLNSSDNSFRAYNFGTSGDKPVAADYDGDGISDNAVWRPSNGTWYIQKSSGGFFAAQFGISGDLPVPGDYDGDGKSDLAVFRPSTGYWYILRSSNGTNDFRAFGLSTDKTAQGDFDGDGKTDVAVFRPSNGVWYIWRSTDGAVSSMSFGTNGDQPVQGDYDGDGKTDIAVWRPSNGTWYLQQSRAGFSATPFGVSTDKPAPGDFDGDGKTDITVFRNGVWYMLHSSDGSFAGTSFGATGDIPVPAAQIAE
jgi:FG-GAP-like repeat